MTMEHVSTHDETTPSYISSASKAEMILQSLSETEIEAAARTSYKYQQLQNVDASVQHSYACNMVERYVSSKSDIDVSLSKIRSTLEFRKNMHLDNINKLTEDSNMELTKYISDGKLFVQGYDIDGHSTLVFIPRYSTDHYNLNRSVLGKVWTLEKAIACSNATDGTINVIVDLAGFSLLYHTPPIKVGKEVLTILRNHYVGHINKIFLVNVPSTFSILWNIFKSFLGSKTKDKIVFAESSSSSSSETFVPKVCSTAIKSDSLYSYYTANEATTWMRRDGEKYNDLNVDRYLNTIPFEESN